MATHGGIEPLVVQSYGVEPHGKDMGWATWGGAHM